MITLQLEESKAEVLRVALENLIRDATLLHGTFGSQIVAQTTPVEVDGQDTVS